MSDVYQYAVRVGGLCCHYGQEVKQIPQPDDNLVLDACPSLKTVFGKLKSGEDVVCGQALYFDPADGCLTCTPAVGCFYGIAKEGVSAATEKCPIVVYTAGGFDIEQITVKGGEVDAALTKEARGLGIHFEERMG